MTIYNPQEIESKWQAYWKKFQLFKAEDPSQGISKPKYYVLDMFPYPSGAGLHVGHPLGYIATDIVSRYKRHKGFNVLHPMGFDSFGLPAEQYAIQTGQHPAITTEKNILTYKKQLEALGFSYDWDAEVRTSDPEYYKWTQWIFIQLFNSWYDKKLDRARPIGELEQIFESEGNANYVFARSIGGGYAVCDEDTPLVTAAQWAAFTPEQKHKLTLHYRLAYLAKTFVNWCPALGTVLANEEVKDGLSERGGHPVIRKEMPQWQLRITAYADRLVKDLDTIDWPEAIKEQQRNWIGRSRGCMLTFKLANGKGQIDVFTTRVDTIYGVTYLTLAPEHELIAHITTPEQREEVEAYVQYAKNKSELDRQADVKTITGVFTGAYAINPVTNKPVPIWIGEYVLAGYGTGAVMAVPSSDPRDYHFARHFNLPIILVQEGPHTDITQEDFDPKAGTMINSDFLNGMSVAQAIDAMVTHVEKLGVGYAKINYRLRDAIFSRQRYWGEPIPIYYKSGMPYAVDEQDLPLKLPTVDAYLPTEDGEPPLARDKNWTYQNAPLETSTMPGWAGSSWYFFRYIDAHNASRFASKPALDYWRKVDLYLGGSEHATGHLLYSRFWTKFLFDLGFVQEAEYAQKLINQGMIQGRSNFVYRINGENTFVSLHLKEMYDTTALYVDVNLVENDILDINRFRTWRHEFADAKFILETKDGNQAETENEGVYVCGVEIEKMSKSKYNVVNPDDIIAKYGADCLRLYEMFLGPLELSKPWNTNSISGVSRFLKNVWKLFYDESGNWVVTTEKPTKAALKILHKTIKKVEDDIERFSFNTSVSTFMVCINELSEIKCRSSEIMADVLVLLSPYAPHISEELYAHMVERGMVSPVDSISRCAWPIFNPDFVIEKSFEYPISINGKVRHKMQFELDKPIQEIEKEVAEAPEIIKWLDSKVPKKIIVVPGRIVNVVV